MDDSPTDSSQEKQPRSQLVWRRHAGRLGLLGSGRRPDHLPLVGARDHLRRSDERHADVDVPARDTTVTLVVNDGYENSDPDAVAVTVLDTIPPTIVCPAPVISECQVNRQSLVAFGPATGSDVCGGITIANSHTPGGADASGSYPLGTTIVTFTATDGSGNVASCQTSVTVVDITAPVISAAAAPPNYLCPPNHKM